MREKLQAANPKVDILVVCAINNLSAELTFLILSKENDMKLTPPKTVTYWVSVVIAVLGFLSQFGVLAFLPISGFWLVAIAFIILALSLLIKGI